jgi:hypothetical protein
MITLSHRFPTSHYPVSDDPEDALPSSWNGALSSVFQPHLARIVAIYLGTVTEAMDIAMAAEKAEPTSQRVYPSSSAGEFPEPFWSCVSIKHTKHLCNVLINLDAIFFLSWSNGSLIETLFYLQSRFLVRTSEGRTQNFSNLHASLLRYIKNISRRLKEADSRMLSFGTVKILDSGRYG